MPARQPTLPLPSPQDSVAHERYYPQATTTPINHRDSYFPPDNRMESDNSPYTLHPEPLYPPLPNSSTYQQNSAPAIRPSLSTEEPSTLSHKPYSSSSLDLNSEENAERSVRPGKEPKVGEETGIKAALWPNSIPCRAYLVAVLAETFINVTIEAVVLLRIEALADSVPPETGVQAATRESRQPVYLGIFVLAHVLQMVLAVDAVYNKNTLQFLFLAIFNFMLMVYGCMQVIEIQGNITSYLSRGATLPESTLIRVLTIGVPVITAIAEVAYVTLGYRIWKEFGWKVYKFLGADRTIKKMYAQYQVFQCFLKFDIFFWVGFGIQWISLVLQNNDFEFYLTLVALPLSLVLLVQGHLAARHETKWMMYVFILGTFTGVAYFVYKAYRIYSFRNETDFVHLWKSLLIFACVSIVLLVTTFIWACIVMSQFGKGLKDNMNKKEEEHKLERKATTYRPGKGRLAPPPVNLKRFSIE